MRGGEERVDEETAAAEVVEGREDDGAPDEAPAKAALVWWVWTVVCWQPVASATTGRTMTGRIFFMGGFLN